MKAKAEWENKTDDVLQATAIRNRINELKKQNEELTEIRRAKLAEKLAEEERQYEQEFINSLETPEQVRAKMAIKLKELRTKREEERLQFVKNMEYKRFKNSTDDIRKLDSKFNSEYAKIEQENQMLEKVKKREEDRQSN